MVEQQLLKAQLSTATLNLISKANLKKPTTEVIGWVVSLSLCFVHCELFVWLLQCRLGPLSHRFCVQCCCPFLCLNKVYSHFFLLAFDLRGPAPAVSTFFHYFFVHFLSSFLFLLFIFLFLFFNNLRGSSGVMVTTLFKHAADQGSILGGSTNLSHCLEGEFPWVKVAH